MICTDRFRHTLLFFLCFLQSPLLLFSASDADALLKFKEPFNKDPVPKAFTTWVKDTVPCPEEGKGGKAWEGIICYRGAITGIRLEDVQGTPSDIDISALEQMEALRIVSVENTSLPGPLPEFNRLGGLKGLFLVDNAFSGEIPADYFSKMLSLKKLWLVGNKFTGPIPTSLSRLANLKELNLQGNEFSGIIPPLPAKLIALNVSNNHLEGKIPDNLSTFGEKSFSGNMGLCGKPLPNECPQAPPAQSSVTSSTTVNSKSSVWIAIAVLVAVVLLLIVATIVVVKRRREFDVLGREAYDDPVEMHIPPPITTAKQMEPTTSSSRGTTSSSRKGSQSGKGSGAGDLCVVNDEKGIFGLPDLMKAAAEVLGNGSLGSAYKAVMTNGVAVVVKRMRDMNKVAKDGFDMEFRRLGALHHRNILTPLAYHYRKEEKLVVYEYIPRGSLLFLLHGDRGSCQAELDWPTRLKIIHGIARGMAFLHTELSSYSLPHGNLKSSNIFLSADYEPLLSDYGFWSVVNPNQATQAMFAYKAPEATEYHLASPKCDVYCFGIVILEILTGKFPSQYLHNGTGGTDVVQWVLSALIEGKETELFDPEIASARDSYNEMEQLLYIGAACVEQNPEKRLTMRDAVRKIEEIQIGQARTATTLKEEYAKLSSSPMH